MIPKSNNLRSLNGIEVVEKQFTLEGFAMAGGLRSLCDAIIICENVTGFRFADRFAFQFVRSERFEIQ